MANDTKKHRVGGSAWTVFRWGNKNILGARVVSHTSPTPVAESVPIQPLDERHPVQIITPNAVSMGQFTADLYEYYGEKVWDRLSNLTGAVDLQGIFNKVAELPEQESISLTKIIKPPTGSGVAPYSEIFHNCVVTNVLDGESIEIGTMQIMKQATFSYTHVTRN